MKLTKFNTARFPIAVRAPGYAERVEIVRSPIPDDANLMVALRRKEEADADEARALEIGGLARDVRGRPLSGWTVTAEPERFVRQRVARPWRFPPGTLVTRAEVGEEGRFSLGAREPGPHVLRLFAPGAGLAWTEELAGVLPGATVELGAAEARRPAALQGTIAAAPGGRGPAAVVLVSELLAEPLVLEVAPATGAFAASLLPAGSYALHVEISDRAPWRAAEFELHPGEERELLPIVVPGPHTVAASSRSRSPGKLFAALLRFAQPVLEILPEDPVPGDIERVCRIAELVWNSVVPEELGHPSRPGRSSSWAPGRSHLSCRPRSRRLSACGKRRRSGPRSTAAHNVERLFKLAEFFQERLEARRLAEEHLPHAAIVLA